MDVSKRRNVVESKKLIKSCFQRRLRRRQAIPIKLLSAYWYEGKCYEFNFSKFWMFTRTKFDCQETDTQIIWHEQIDTTLRYAMVNQNNVKLSHRKYIS